MLADYRARKKASRMAQERVSGSERHPDTSRLEEVLALNRDQFRVALEQILKLCGGLHPVVRRPLVLEARRLWAKAGISEPMPRVQETSRRRELHEYAARRRRKHQRRPLHE